MTHLRADHAAVFEFFARHTGAAPRTIERHAEVLRARFPEAWPSITPGRKAVGAGRLEVDDVHLTLLTLSVVGSPSIRDAADAAACYTPMLSEAAFEASIIGQGIARLPGTPDPFEWPLGRFVHHLIVNQIDVAGVTLCLSAPVAMLTLHEPYTDLRFGPAPRPDGLTWFPRYMGHVVADRKRAVTTLRTAPGPFLAALGGLLRAVEDAPPVRQRAADRLDDLRLLAA